MLHSVSSLNRLQASSCWFQGEAFVSAVYSLNLIDGTSAQYYNSAKQRRPPSLLDVRGHGKSSRDTRSTRRFTQYLVLLGSYSFSPRSIGQSVARRALGA